LANPLVGDESERANWRRRTPSILVNVPSTVRILVCSSSFSRLRLGVTSTQVSQTFSSDNLDGPTSGSHPFLGTAQSFTYDPVGNRTTGGSIVDVGNQVAEDVRFVYVHDTISTRSRMPSKTTSLAVLYTYDHVNRLMTEGEFTEENPTLAFASMYHYDGLGLKMEREGEVAVRHELLFALSSKCIPSVQTIVCHALESFLVFQVKPRRAHINV